MATSLSWTLALICASLKPAASVSEGSYMLLAGLEGLIFLVSSVPSGSYTFSISLFPKPCREGFDRAECSKDLMSDL